MKAAQLLVRYLENEARSSSSACPVDYRENMKLTERLQKLVSPV